MVLVEVIDIHGTSFLYGSSSQQNPVPLTPDTVCNETTGIIRRIGLIRFPDRRKVGHIDPIVQTLIIFLLESKPSQAVSFPHHLLIKLVYVGGRSNSPKIPIYKTHPHPSHPLLHFLPSSFTLPSLLHFPLLYTSSSPTFTLSLSPPLSLLHISFMLLYIYLNLAPTLYICRWCMWECKVREVMTHFP